MSVLLERTLRVFDEIWAEKTAFFSVFFVVLLVSYGILFAIDFIPEKPESPEEVPLTVGMEPAGQTPGTQLVQNQATSSLSSVRDAARYPERVIIDELDVDVDVLNPRGDSIAELDAALLEGVVRHPGSADFRTTGTILLFGHSSYLPTVHNRNFQAFNGIQKLTWGDMIRVQSEDSEYVYRVTKVYKAAASETTVELDNSSEKLMLVTCNSFGSKDDRFVVEAELIETKSL